MPRGKESLSSGVILTQVGAMTELRAILFDKDGTLFDFQATWASFTLSFLEDLSDGDPVLTEVLATAIGFDQAARRYAPTSIAISGTPEDMADHLIPHLPGTPDRRAIVNNMVAASADIPLMEAVPLVPYLADLAGRGLRLAVITNDAEEPALAHLRAVGVADAFDFVAGYDSGHGAKPGPGQVLAACASLGIDPAEALMVGDSTHDLLAGRAAGSGTIGVLTGLARHDDLASLADAVLPDIGHLPAWLDARTA